MTRILATTAGLVLALGAVALPAWLASHDRAAECPGAWAIFCEMDQGAGR